MNGCYSLAIGIAMLMILHILKIPLWIVFLLVSFSLSILVGGLDFLVNIIFDVSTDPATIDLVVIMYLIAVFVSLYRMTGFIDKLGEELTLLLKKPFIVISFVPAILGLLSVPGGALMWLPVHYIFRYSRYFGNILHGLLPLGHLICLGGSSEGYIDRLYLGGLTGKAVIAHKG